MSEIKKRHTGNGSRMFFFFDGLAERKKRQEPRTDTDRLLPLSLTWQDKQSERDETTTSQPNVIRKMLFLVRGCSAASD